MSRISRVVLSCASLAAMVVSTPLAQAAEPLVQVSSAQSAPPGARPLYPTSPSTRISLRVVLQPRHADQLARFITASSMPGSAFYGRYLSPRQFASTFAPRLRTRDAVASYWRAAGLEVTPSSNPLVLDVTGTASEVERALHTHFIQFAALDGQRGYVATSRGVMPAPLATAVAGISGLSSFTRATPRLAANSTRPVLSSPTACSAATAAATARHEYLPAQIAQGYGVDTALANGFDGSGRKVAVVEFASYYTSDMTSYFNCFGLSNSITKIAVRGGAPSSSASTDGIEVELDMQMIAGVAPGASILDYEHANDANAWVDTFGAIATDHQADTISVSWGSCEPDDNAAAIQPLLMQLAAQGQSVFTSSGDSGSSDCAYGAAPNVSGTDYSAQVDVPSDSPWVTAVGGLTVSSFSPLTQSVWGGTCSGYPCGGGGGFSSDFAHPSWQVGPGTNSSLGRQIPDLSVMADPHTGMLTYYSGSWSGVGGTSIGAPLVAAMVAVGAQACSAQRFGLLNPRLYQMAIAGTGFNDVTTGTNDIYGIGSYAATTGYDMASGLGSPDPATFLPSLCNQTQSSSFDTYGTGSAAAWSFTYVNANQALIAGSSTITLNSLVAGGLSTSSADYTINGVHPQSVSASATGVTLTVANTVAAKATITLTAANAINAATAGQKSITVTDSNGFAVYFPVTFTTSQVGSLTLSGESSAKAGSTGAVITATVRSTTNNALSGVSIQVNASGTAVVTAIPNTSGQRGTAMFRVSDGATETVTVTASAGGVTSAAWTISFTNPWTVSKTKLTPASGALVGTPVSSFNCGTVARTSKGALYSSNSSVNAVLTSTKGASLVPLAGSDPAVGDGASGLCEIAYVGKDAKARLLAIAGNTVVTTQLSNYLGGNSLIGSPGLIQTAYSTYVVAISTGNHLMMATKTGTKWTKTDLSNLSGLSLARGGTYALANATVLAGGYPAVVLRTGKYLYLISYSSLWSQWSATNIPAAAFWDVSGTRGFTGSPAVIGGTDVTIFARTSAGHVIVFSPDPLNAGFYIGTDISATYTTLKATSDVTIFDYTTPKAAVISSSNVAIIAPVGTTSTTWSTVFVSAPGTTALFGTPQSALQGIAPSKLLTFASA